MKRLLTLALSALPALIFAHPGHGTTDGNSLIHYFSTPEHSIPAAGIVLLVAFVLFKRWRKSLAS